MESHPGSPVAQPGTPAETAAVPRVRLGNVPLTPVGMTRAVALIGGWAGREPFRLVVTPNVDHVVIMQRNAPFAHACARADLSLPDGVPVLWAARYLGLGRLEKVSGSDLAPALCARGAAAGWRVFCIGGGSAPALDATLAIIGGRHPGLILGGHCPPWGFENEPAAEERLLSAIEAFRPDVLLMACGSPKSEVWMDRRRDRLGRGVGLSIGAGLDFLAGQRTRAPRWMQRAGLEWAWRLMREPRRLWRRYLVDDVRFFPLVWRWKHPKHP